MVASRNISAGETIFVEAPLTFGPSEETKPVCLGCYERVESAKVVCRRCGFPMCSKACAEVEEHKNQVRREVANSGSSLQSPI